MGKLAHHSMRAISLPVEPDDPTSIAMPKERPDQTPAIMRIFSVVD
jgi:hypothetical protein